MKRILLIPSRLNQQLTDHHSRIFKILLMILILITGLYTRDYRGEYQETVNNNVGGIFYVMFGSVFISILFPSLKEIVIVSLSFAITCMIEIVQYFQFPIMLHMAKYKLTAYLFGSSFNHTDFIYYGIGAVCSWLLLLLIKKNELNS